MILHPPATPTTQLSYDPESRQYVGEISSTNGFGQVYDDACDVGMTLVSTRTGNEIVFVVHQTHIDAEGDTTHWTLRPAQGTAECEADFPGGPRSVLLFND